MGEAGWGGQSQIFHIRCPLHWATLPLPCCGSRHYHSLPSHRVNWPQEMLCHLILGCYDAERNEKIV